MNKNERRLTNWDIVDNAISRGDCGQLFLEDVKRRTVLTKSEEAKAISLAKKGNCEARNQLTVSFLGLVAGKAKCIWGTDYGDLVQVGAIEVMQEVPDLNLRKGRPPTYLTYGIRAAMFEEVANNFPARSIPSNVLQILSDLSSVRERKSQELGRDPGAEDLVDDLKVKLSRRRGQGISGFRVTTETVKEWLNLLEHSPALLETEAVVEDEFALLEEKIDRERAINEFRAILNDGVLTDKEKTCLSLVFGFEDPDYAMSQDKAGEILGMDGSNVGYHIRKAMKKLKKNEQAQKAWLVYSRSIVPGELDFLG